MSGTTGFLFQGSALPAAPTGSDTATAYPLWLQSMVYNLGNAASNVASQPYTPYPGPTVAQPSQATQEAWGMAQNNVGNYQPLLQSAVDQTSTAGQPIPTPNTITAPTIGPYAAPQFNAVTANAIGADDINKYMNPYMDSVIGSLRQQANQNLYEDVLPRVSDRFVSSGQSRSPQEVNFTAQAVGRSQQALDNAMAGALSSGYNTALGTAQQQQGFLTNLAQQQQGAKLGLDTNQQNYLTSLAQRERDFQTALAQQQQGVGINVAQGNRQAAQTTGAQLGQLGALSQQLSAADTGQLAAAGQAQDQINQANINAAINAFQAQNQWPYQNLAFASNIIRGLPVNTNQQVVGQTYNVPYSASPLSQFLGSALGISALGLKDGGHVRRDGALSVWRKV